MTDAGSVLDETTYGPQKSLFMELFEASRAKGLACCTNNTSFQFKEIKNGVPVFLLETSKNVCKYQACEVEYLPNGSTQVTILGLQKAIKFPTDFPALRITIPGQKLRQRLNPADVFRTCLRQIIEVLGEKVPITVVKNQMDPRSMGIYANVLGLNRPDDDLTLGQIIFLSDPKEIPERLRCAVQNLPIPSSIVQIPPQPIPEYEISDKNQIRIQALGIEVSINIVADQNMEPGKGTISDLNSMDTQRIVKYEMVVIGFHETDKMPEVILSLEKSDFGQDIIDLNRLIIAAFEYADQFGQQEQIQYNDFMKSGDQKYLKAGFMRRYHQLAIE
jgi:hypothetical protein